MSYQPYTMPPPMPVDPTDVAGKRIAAWVIDAVIYVVISNVLGALTGLRPTIRSLDFAPDDLRAQRFCDSWKAVNEGLCLHSGGQVTMISDLTKGAWLFLGLLIVFIVYQGLLGASLGKLALGLRIVKADGSRAGVGASAIRTLLWIIDAITCAMPILGGILMLTTKGHRRLGDTAAGTYVVPHQHVGHPVILPGDHGWGTYQQMSAYGGFAPQPGQPVYGPPPGTGPTPWAPAPQAGPGPGPWIADHGPSSGAAHGDYEADTPIWDEARHAYIQYDSARGAWLEFDDRVKEWKPIST